MVVSCSLFLDQAAGGFPACIATARYRRHERANEQLRRIRTPQIPISPYAERLIGTIRRDCLDHVLIFGERHLRRALTLYSRYYNETRTHLG